jgi:hypothetical protein
MAANSVRGTMIAKTEDVIHKGGRSVEVSSIRIEDKRVIVEGRLLTIARLKDEWYDDIGDPELITRALREHPSTPDIFTFWQRLPDTTPVFSYYHEPEALSAVPLTDFEHWWTKQISSDMRKKAKRAEKRGVEIRIVSLDDDLVRGVMGIFNETPVRRGRRFWHYGKDFDSVKEILSRDLDTSRFLAAYFEGELVGISSREVSGQCPLSQIDRTVHFGRRFLLHLHGMEKRNSRRVPSAEWIREDNGPQVLDSANYQRSDSAEAGISSRYTHPYPRVAS